jgi:hypothetical protein
MPMEIMAAVQAGDASFCLRHLRELRVIVGLLLVFPSSIVISQNNTYLRNTFFFFSKKKKEEKKNPGHVFSAVQSSTLHIYI